MKYLPAAALRVGGGGNCASKYSGVKLDRPTKKRGSSDLRRSIRQGEGCPFVHYPCTGTDAQSRHVRMQHTRCIAGKYSTCTSATVPSDGADIGETILPTILAVAILGAVWCTCEQGARKRALDVALGHGCRHLPSVPKSYHSAAITKQLLFQLEQTRSYML